MFFLSEWVCHGMLPRIVDPR